MARLFVNESACFNSLTGCERIKPPTLILHAAENDTFSDGTTYPFFSYSGSRRSLACAGANTLKNQSWRVFETRRHKPPFSWVQPRPWYHHKLRERCLQDRRKYTDTESVALSAHGETMGGRQYLKNQSWRVFETRRDDIERSVRAHEPSCFEDSPRPSAIARGKRKLKTCGYQNKRFSSLYEVFVSAA